MIIGNGLIAKSFKKYKKYFKDIIIFASGAANSKSTDLLQFQRENKIINKFIKEKRGTFIYFSTLDIYRKKKTPYIRHKTDVEKRLLREKNVLVVRLPQLIGKSKNKNTVYNFLKFNLKKKNKKIIIFKNFYRNFIDVEDLINIIKKINFKKNRIKSLNIFNKKSIRINAVFNFFVNQKIVKNKIYEFDQRKDNFYYDTTKFRNDKFIIVNNKNYYENLFKKYIKF